MARLTITTTAATFILSHTDTEIRSKGFRGFISTFACPMTGNRYPGRQFDRIYFLIKNDNFLTFNCIIFVVVDLVKRGLLTLVDEIQRSGNDDDDDYYY